MCIGLLFLQDSARSPFASTGVPQMQVCSWNIVELSQSPTAIRIALLDRCRPTAVIGGAFSQSPDSGVATALNLPLSTRVVSVDWRSM